MLFATFIIIFVIVVVLYHALLVKMKDTMLRYAMVLPAFLTLFIITILPFIYTVYISIHSVTELNIRKGNWKFVGIKHYAQFFLHDPEFYQSLIRTLEFSLYSIALEILLG